MSAAKLFIKQYLLPSKLLKFLRPYYHGCVSLFAHFYFGRPSNKLIVIGVTGTNGKSTTVNLIARILEQAGYKTGYTSTVTIKVGSKEHLNSMKMTMPSGWVLHKWLAAMVKNGLQYAVLEVSSEGLAQNRHLGINFDVALFTNLTPEHIESHGSFENYKRAKGRLFETINNLQLTIDKKQINPHLKKTVITNLDDSASSYYASFAASQYITYAVKNSRAEVKAADIRYAPEGVKFSVELMPFAMQLKGQFDVYNALAAIAAAKSQNVSLDVCRQALENIPVVPGRVEVLQSSPFTVVVDYAYEPEEMRQLYETVERWPHNRLLQVLGPTGGGRDQARISVLGEMAARFAAEVWVTTDDPYDENPNELAQPMVEGATKEGKILGKDVHLQLDRRVAICEAFKAALPGDIVLITGKGADQKMALAGGMYVEWDDREVVREELGKIFN